MFNGAASLITRNLRSYITYDAVHAYIKMYVYIYIIGIRYVAFNANIFQFVSKYLLNSHIQIYVPVTNFINVLFVDCQTLQEILILQL
jgi:hypothetical protein